MWGALTGDIAGSRFEGSRGGRKDFELSHRLCTYTDDSVCTAAVGEIILNDRRPEVTLQCAAVTRAEATEGRFAGGSRVARRHPPGVEGHLIWRWPHRKGGTSSTSNQAPTRDRSCPRTKMAAPFRVGAKNECRRALPVL